MSEHRYDRKLNPQEVMDYLFNRTDLSAYFNSLTITTATIDLYGTSYTGINRATKKELKDRHYVVFWHLSGELGILWLDEVVLSSTDPRITGTQLPSGGITRSAPVDVLTVTEYELLCKRLRRYRLPTHPDWGDPVHVVPNQVTVWTPAPETVPMKVMVSMRFQKFLTKGDDSDG